MRFDALASILSHVWPARNWSLRLLSEAQYAAWERDGVVVVKGAVPPALAAAAAAAVHEFVGANASDSASWYRNVLDIYEDILPDGRKPPHGPCGMVQMFHHESLWALRQHPRVHAAFADVYGTARLWVTADRAHFKPPESSAHPAWSDPGQVHVGLHWDVETGRDHWPVPFAVQGVVYLEDTALDQGPLHVVPGFHRQFAAWDAAQSAGRDGRRPAPDSTPRAVPVAASAGDLVLWHSLLPHGPGRNVGARPRISAYVAMLPVDAAPFLGGRRADAPLSMSDAGTLDYDDPALAAGLVRLGRAERARRWRERLPLLAEDPHELELPWPPPGETHARPAPLTPLGERLVGVVEWEADPEERHRAGRGGVAEATHPRAVSGRDEL